MANLPASSVASYVDQIQRSIFEIQRVFLPNGSYSFTGNIDMNNYNLNRVASISGHGGSIDLSTTGQINLVSASVRMNGSASVAGPNGAVNGNFAVFDTTSGQLIKDSGVAPGSYLSLTGGSMTGPIDSASALNLGTVTATSVNLGRDGGYVSARQPAIYVNFPNSVNPTVTSNVVTGISRSATLSGTAVDFTLDTATGIVTYTGPVARTMQCIYLGGISYLTSGYNLYSALIVNPGVPPIMPSADAHLIQTSTGSVGAIGQHFVHGRFTMNPGDTIQLCFRNQSGPTNDVTFQVARLSIFALMN